MSSPSRTFDALLRLAATSITFLGLGLALWFLFLGAAAVSGFIQYSRHMHQPTHGPLSFLDTGLGVAIAYGVTFFVAAALVARLRWHYRASTSAFIAYTVFLLIYLPCLDWSRGFSPDIFSLIVPLITAPLGGLIGERLFAKPQSA